VDVWTRHLQSSVVLSPIRVVAVDIDGTLTNPQFHVPERNIAALRAAHDAGIQIVLATGRRHDYAMPVARELGVPILLVSSNGALVRSSDGETLFTECLPTSTAHKLIRYMDQYRGHAVLTFDRPHHPGNGALVLERVDELAGSVSRWLEANRPYMKFVVPLEDALTENPVQAMYCGSVSFMKGVQAWLEQAEFLDDLTILKTQYDHRDLCLLDILAPGCSKGHALRRWAQEQGIAREEIMAIGDNYNDLEMLEFAGLPVIMANASDDLKQNGWRETASNSEDGVALAIEELLRTGFRSPIRRE